MHQRLLPLAALLLFVLSAFSPAVASAVQFGWQPLPDGGLEYLVQVEPDLLDSFRQQGFTSDIPPSMQGQLRRIHISVGDAKLPNQGDVMGPRNSTMGSAPAAQQPEVMPARNDQLSPMPAKNPAFEPNTSSPRQPTTAAPLPSSSITQPPAGNTASNSDQLNLPPPPGMDDQKSTTDSAAADLPHSFSLPFFHQGQLKQLQPDGPANSGPSGTTNGSSPSTAPSTAGGNTAAGSASGGQQNQQITQPRWSGNDAATGGLHTFSSDAQTVGAAKPAVSDSGWTAEKADGTATPKPWLPLMGALLALFASLGANAYLAWIHQGVRAKYRALVQRLPAGSAAATL